MRDDRLCILLYTDDVIIMSESGVDLQSMPNAVHKYSPDICVKFSEEESKVVVINGVKEDRDRAWKLGDICVKKAKEYKYLGVTVTDTESKGG